MTEKSAANFSSTKTVRKIKYENGQIVSNETHTSNNSVTPITNCPNCGAHIEPGNTGICRYCNTSFNTYQINNQ